MTQYSINQHSLNQPDRNQLEQLWQPPAAQLNSSSATTPQSTSLIRQVLAALSTFLTGSQQIRIWTKSTKQGVVWFAYDPASDQRIGHCSENELRTWLETRYHQ